MTTLVAIGIAAAFIGACAMLVQAFANRAHAANNEAQADELDALEEALHGAAAIGADIAAGTPPTVAVVKWGGSDEAKDLLKRFKVFAHLALVLLAVTFLATGCTSEQLQSAEDKAHSALLAVDSGIGWVEGHPDSVAALLDAAQKVDPNSATLQAVTAKAKAALEAGDLERVQAVVRAGAILTQPAGPPVVTAPPVPK